MDDRDRGRAAYRRRAWLSAFDAFGRAEHAGGLSADDLELMAASGYMLDRYDEAWQALGHAYRIRLHGGDPAGAARCAAWLGLGLLAVGEDARAAGWLGRAGRLLDGVDLDCVERGYLLIPAVLEELGAGRAEAALRASTRVAEIGERFSEPDLVAFALVKRGRALLRLGRTRDGLALLDEAMVGADDGRAGLTGADRAAVLQRGSTACHEVHELRRARAWTAALTSWCDAQPEMVNFARSVPGAAGRDPAARGGVAGGVGRGRAGPRTADRALPAGGRGGPLPAGRAAAVAGPAGPGRGRLPGGQPVRLVSPQPGLALLRLAQGRAGHRGPRDPAHPDRDDRPARAGPAAAGRGRDPARRGRCRGRAGRRPRADRHRPGSTPGDVLGARAAVARAGVALANGDPRTALIALRRGCAVWQGVDLPYELARARLLIVLACRMLGDEDSAALELDAARTVLDPARSGGATWPVWTH